MGALTGQTIASSYEQLLHCDADGGLTTSLQAIKDGDNGITSALKLARDKVEVLPSGADSATAFEVSQNDGTAILTVNSSSPTVTITGDGVVTDDLTLNSDASVLTFGAGSDVTFTHDNGTGMNVASAGDFDIAVSAGNGTFTVADGQTLTLGQSGASAILLSPHGTAGSELASLINTAGTTDGSDAAGSILLSAVAGGMSFAWNDAKDLWAEGGRFVVTANEDAADCIKLHADAGTSQAITLLNDAGTGAAEGSAAIQLLASAGGVNIKGNVDAANAVLLTADGGTSATMVMHNDQGTAATSLNLLSDDGGITLNPGTQVFAEGTIKMKEQADADSDTVAYGQVWVNTATPNELYFTTDAGDDIQITSGTALAGVTFASGDTDNYVTTSNGSGALVGESGLTFGSNVLTVTGNILPEADGTRDLGSASYQWQNIYTGDLNLNNTRGDGNEVDGTSGSWTIQEGSDNLFIINRKTGKQYKFSLEEMK